MTTLYRAYDAEDRLLYIGVSDSMVRRMAGHRNCTEWYPNAVRWTSREYSTRCRAEAVEAKAILLLRPIHNIIGQRDQAKRWGTGTKLPHLTRKARKEALARLQRDKMEPHE